MKGEWLWNVVFMGMGELLYNYDVVMKVVDIFCDFNGFVIGVLKIMLSMVGVILGIMWMVDEGWMILFVLSLYGVM